MPENASPLHASVKVADCVVASVGGVLRGVVLATPFCGVQKGTKLVGVLFWEISDSCVICVKATLWSRGQTPTDLKHDTAFVMVIPFTHTLQKLP